MKIIDNLVVGSGPGGAITVKTLIDNNYQVEVIEAGENFTRENITPFSIDEMIYKYWAGGMTVMLGKPKISYVMGKCLGGGSEVNSGFYHRLPKDILNYWNKKFELKIQSLDEYFSYCEEMLNIRPMPKENVPKSSLKLLEGAQKLNWSCQEIPRAFKYLPTQSIKQSMTQTFLNKKIRSTVKINKKIMVKKIKKVDGIWHVYSYENKTFFCKNLFLCAGAIQTPSILLRSGIKKNIGQTLQAHPTIKITALFDEEVNSNENDIAVHQIKEFSPEISMGCSISTMPYLDLALSNIEGYENFARKYYKRMSTYYSMITPSSHGKIKVMPFSKDPLVYYQLDKSDIEMIKEALIKLAEVLFTAGAKKLFPSTLGSNLILKREDDFKSSINQLKNE
ncbi:MAG: GMC family oxidoreductase N-terminal domain-containing protein, partial [Halobacteriovoraceae bacterium]|nr:GMC family oxidoreductase N-terminal domain-containing protein [Halobacteriovoraceae bacterium]